jgi:Tfp pilus assembly protein PilN
MELQEASYSTTKLLDALAKTVPDAITLIKLTREEDHIKLVGKAQSDNQISILMEKIARNKLFSDLELTGITAKENAAGDERIFELRLKLNELTES